MSESGGIEEKLIEFFGEVKELVLERLPRTVNSDFDVVRNGLVRRLGWIHHELSSNEYSDQVYDSLFEASVEYYALLNFSNKLGDESEPNVTFSLSGYEGLRDISEERMNSSPRFDKDIGENGKKYFFSDELVIDMEIGLDMPEQTINDIIHNCYHTLKRIFEEKLPLRGGNPDEDRRYKFTDDSKKALGQVYLGLNHAYGGIANGDPHVTYRSIMIASNYCRILSDAFDIARGYSYDTISAKLENVGVSPERTPVPRKSRSGTEKFLGTDMRKKSRPTDTIPNKNKLIGVKEYRIDRNKIDQIKDYVDKLGGTYKS